MRIAWLTPLPPVKSGIAGYSAMLLPALATKSDVVAVVDQPSWDEDRRYRVIPVAELRERRSDFDVVFAQLGNNLHHEFIYRYAMEFPSIAVLHDAVLHHLIVEMTMARGDIDGYVRALRANHGETGAAWALGRATGLHYELGNFLLPASIELANRSGRVIVHNQYAAETLRRHGVTTPIDVIGHPLERFDLTAPPARLPFDPSNRVIGMFGFITMAKRPEVVFEAFARALRQNPSLRLLLVGQPASTVDLETLARSAGVARDTWQATGYVADEEFDSYLLAVDRVINLRYPSAGETSGALLRVFAAGKPVAVSRYAQFNEYPSPAAIAIPLGPGEVDALTEFFLMSDSRNLEIGSAQRAWLESHASLNTTVDQYLESATTTISPSPAAERVEAGIPLFPSLQLEAWLVEGRQLSLHIRNIGTQTLRASVYGEPAYQLLVKLFEGDQERFDQWVPLSGDLRTGRSVRLDLIIPARGKTLRLYHALGGVPQLDLSPFATLEIRS